MGSLTDATPTLLFLIHSKNVLVIARFSGRVNMRESESDLPLHHHYLHHRLARRRRAPLVLRLRPPAARARPPPALQAASALGCRSPRGLHHPVDKTRQVRSLVRLLLLLILERRAEGGKRRLAH
jgi:hypothetical protein